MLGRYRKQTSKVYIKGSKGTTKGQYAEHSGKSSNQSYHDFYLDSHNSDEKRITKNKFTEAEDAKLAELVELHGDAEWKKISAEMGTRNPRQCRERWKNYIAPTVRKDDWTQEEDDLLMKKYRSIGPRWSQIRSHYKGRSVNDIRNRWLKLMRLEKKGKILTKSTKSSQKFQILDPEATTSSSSSCYSSSSMSSSPAISPHNNEDDVSNSATDDEFITTQNFNVGLSNQSIFSSSSESLTENETANEVDVNQAGKSKENSDDNIAVVKKERNPFDILFQDTIVNLFTESPDDSLAIFHILDFYY
ncbi:hypothetical protein TRFO_18183 [Tritrichomonas foetus]|uniref:Myb-like DNA-binding domain containing protein n=1 Tax=Tritrichomonas foetus TaxID=1144522 RepID=A0A1J4KLJ1_9EUKA|nr:hypothetical protein TRFO_18183 [Tritrichomonas foetus]|eukprot:OHT12175.1 hypothetical protein TRFO_18183 [Tritrichomonas foetus]